MPGGGLEAQSFGNSLTLNKIALATEYNRLADFATKSINSIESFRPIKFVTLWTPRRLTCICRMDTKLPWSLRNFVQQTLHNCRLDNPCAKLKSKTHIARQFTRNQAP